MLGVRYKTPKGGRQRSQGPNGQTGGTRILKEDAHEETGIGVLDREVRNLKGYLQGHECDP